MNNVSHVLEWTPGYLCETGRGFWSIQTIENYNNGLSENEYDESNLSKKADIADLTRYVYGQLKFKPILHYATHQISLDNITFKTEPIYFIEKDPIRSRVTHYNKPLRS